MILCWIIVLKGIGRATLSTNSFAITSPVTTKSESAAMVSWRLKWLLRYPIAKSLTR